MTDRVSLIEAITTVLGFFVLVLLIVEATLIANILAVPADLRAVVAYSAIAIIVLVLLLVAGIAIWRPSALYAPNRLDDAMAHSLAVDVYSAFSMYVSNLPSADERLEAYETLAAVIDTGGSPYDEQVRKSIAKVVRGRAAVLGGTHERSV